MKSNKSTSQKIVFLITLVLFAVLLITGCGTRARVGALQSESQSVELGDAESVRVEIVIGAGDLELTGGTDKLLEADFTYNVAMLKPEVKYTNGKLVVRQPDAKGLPALQDITDFRNEWDLRLNDELPIDLSVDMGAGSSNLQLAGLPLARLDVILGAGTSTVDLSGDWVRDLDVTIDTGAADITVRLPRDVGARVEVEAGPTTIKASGLRRDGNVFTNDAYGGSEVTLQVNIEAGIGQTKLEIEEAAATSHQSSANE